MACSRVRASFVTVAALLACNPDTGDSDTDTAGTAGTDGTDTTGAPTTATTATTATSATTATTATTATSATTATTATTDTPTTGETGEPVDPDAITYYGHVRPVLARHCVACHTAGGIAPLALDSYESARPFAPMIAASTAARQMPPYPADNSGDCHTFRDARWLTDEELALLADWHEQGALEGDPATPPPEVPPLPQLTGDIRTLTMPEPYTPNAKLADDYRCFVVDSPTVPGTDTYITGFDVRPGDPRIVHHVVVFAPRNAKAAADAIARDEAEDGPGYTCFGTAQIQADIVAAWAPGGGATRFPDDTGTKIEPLGKVVMQVHYNTLAAPGASDSTEVDLSVASEGVTPMLFLALADTGLSLPPDQDAAPAGMKTTMKNAFGIDVPTKIRGVFPHMHTLGRTLRLDLDDACMLDVPRWDFHWQLLYFYDQPLAVQPNQALTMACNFDTHGREGVTHWGEGTGDEMCVAGLWVTE